MRPAKPKPQAFEEVARVLNIVRMLDEEVRALVKTSPIWTGWEKSDLLAVAERIAARTEG